MFLFTSMFLSSFSHSPFSGMPKGTQKPHSRRKGETLRRCAFLCVCVCGHARFSNILYYATRKRVLQAYFVRKRGKTRFKKSFCGAKICLKEKFCEKFSKTADFSKKGMEIRKHIWYNKVRRNSE
ncbi:hypothetical protein ACTNEV_09195 [Oscillospiraceae bacterium HCP3S3_D12]